MPAGQARPSKDLFRHVVKAARSSLDSSFAQAAATAIASGGASLMTANAPPRPALESAL